MQRGEHTGKREGIIALYLERFTGQKVHGSTNLPRHPTRTSDQDFRGGLRKRLNRPRANLGGPSCTGPLIARVEEDDLQSRVEELQGELRDYYRTGSGDVDPEVLRIVDGVVGALTGGSITMGRTRWQLSGSAGLWETQSGRCEARGHDTLGRCRRLPGHRCQCIGGDGQGTGAGIDGPGEGLTRLPCSPGKGTRFTARNIFTGPPSRPARSAI